MADLDIVLAVQDQTAKGVQSASRRLGKVGGQRGPLGAITKRAGLAVAAIGGIAGVAVAAGVALVDHMAEGARQLLNVSEATGVSTDALQAWGLAAERSGGSAEDIQDAVREMSLRLGEAAELGSGPAVDALDAIGISLSDLQALAPEQQFDLLRDSLSSIEDPARRVFLAEELLGSSTENLAGIIAATPADFDAMAQAAADSGRVLSEDALEGAVDADNAIDDLIGVLKNVVTDALVPLLPHITAAAEKLQEVLGPALKNVGPIMEVVIEIMGYLFDAMEGTGPIAEAVVGFYENLRDRVLAVWQAVRDAVQTAIDAVVGAFNTARDAIQTAIDAVIFAVETVTFAVETARDALRNALGAVVATFRSVRSAITAALDVVGDAVARVTGAIAQAFQTAWDAVTGGTKAAINTVISGLNAVPAAMVSGVNAIVRGLNSINVTIPSWVPFVGGRSFGVNIPELPAPPRIPLLASGGIVTSPTLAVIGERGPEAVVPLGPRSPMNRPMVVNVYLDGGLLGSAIVPAVNAAIERGEIDARLI